MEISSHSKGGSLQCSCFPVSAWPGGAGVSVGERTLSELGAELVRWGTMTPILLSGCAEPPTGLILFGAASAIESRWRKRWSEWLTGIVFTVFKGVVIRDPSKQCTAARGDACSDIPSCVLSFGAKVPYPRPLDPESLPRDRFVSQQHRVFTASHGQHYLSRLLASIL